MGKRGNRLANGVLKSTDSSSLNHCIFIYDSFIHNSYIEKKWNRKIAVKAFTIHVNLLRWSYFRCVVLCCASFYSVPLIIAARCLVDVSSINLTVLPWIIHYSWSLSDWMILSNEFEPSIISLNGSLCAIFIQWNIKHLSYLSFNIDLNLIKSISKLLKCVTNKQMIIISKSIIIECK